MQEGPILNLNFIYVKYKERKFYKYFMSEHEANTPNNDKIHFSYSLLSYHFVNQGENLV